MKIAVNTRFLLKDKIEGIGRVTYELVRRMVKNHPEDEFVLMFDRPFEAAFVFGENVTPVVVSPPARHPFLWYLWFEYSVPTVLKKHQPDVFFSPDGYCSLSTDIPQVMITHDLAHVHYPNEIPFLVRQYYQRFVPRFLEKADHVISVSEATKQDIISTYSIPSKKITTVHNGNRDGFAPLSEKEKTVVKKKYTDGDDYFLYVGAVHPRKNLERLIAAFDLFKKNTGSDIKLLIGGRLAWQTDAVKKATAQARFKDDVQFLGFIPDGDLSDLMASALGFVYVSLFEGFGLPILEAMYAEVPVITSDVSAMPEVAGEAALLVQPGSVEAIAAAMQELYSNEGLRKKLVESGKEQRQKFDWDNAAERVYTVLNKSIS